MEERDRLLAEFEHWLEAEHIDLPPERRLGALPDFADIRRHVAIVDAASQSNAEPATVFVMTPTAVSRT